MSEPAGYAAVYRPSRMTDETICYAWGDSVDQCKFRAHRLLNVDHDRVGRSIYQRLTWEPLDADQASEVAEMLDAEWLFWGGVP